MRLTLRTMLAYLDDVLDSANTQELEHKIEESSFASGLVDRVRDSMRRAQLGAPKVDGRGLGLDANTVSEYLDSTLAHNRVPEFEKVCLESDVHLAEVASCHQILTLVLGEPAQVEAAMRERAYRIGHSENRQHKEHPVGSGASAVAVAQADGVRATSEGGHATRVSPADAQRPSPLSVKSLVITLLLGFLIAFVAFQSVGVNKVRGWIGLSPPTEVVQSPSEAPEAVGPETALPASADSPPPETKEADVPPPVAAESPVTPPSDQIKPDLPEETPAPREIVPAEEPSLSTGAEVMEDAAENVVDRPLVEDGEVPLRGDTPMPPEGTGVETPGDKEEASSEPAEVTAAEPPRLASVGRYISEEEQVLARFDDDAGDWFRVAPHSPLFTGQRVIALPTYRPQLLLSPSIKVTLAGESHLRLGSTDDADGPLLKLDSGRAIIVPLGDLDAAVRIEVAGRSGAVLFSDADSMLAIEVVNFLPPGQLPELEPAIPVVQIFALSGQVAWQEAGAEAIHVDIGQVLAMEGTGAPNLFHAEEVPAWVVGKDLAAIDKDAAAELRRVLATDRPLSLSLLERTEFRRIEVRSLACRSLCALDMFDPAIKALDGTALRSYWQAQFDALRGAMARSAEAAVKLQRSLEKLTGEDASLTYELLCGFSPDQLAAGGALVLVDALEHERVSTRVLAYENLRRITDKTQLFRPEQPVAQQKGEVMKWRRNLAAGTIVYQHPPRALPERRPLSEEASGGGPATE